MFAAKKLLSNHWDIGIIVFLLVLRFGKQGTLFPAEVRYLEKSLALHFDHPTPLSM